MTEMNFRRISIHSLDSSHLCRPSPPSCHWLLRSDLQEPVWGTPSLSSGGSRPANPLLRCQRVRGRAGTRGQWRAHTACSRAAAAQEGGRVLPELLLFQEKLRIWGFRRSFAVCNVGKAQKR